MKRPYRSSGSGHIAAAFSAHVLPPRGTPVLGDRSPQLIVRCFEHLDAPGINSGREERHRPMGKCLRI